MKKLMRIFRSVTYIPNIIGTILFFNFFYPFNISADSFNKKIYISEIIAKKGISQKLGERFQFILSNKLHSELSSTLLNLDPNFTKSYKDSLLKKDSNPCSPNTCENWMLKTFQPSHRLKGEIELAGIKLKLTLYLENIATNSIEKTSISYLPLNDFEDDLEIFINEFFEKKTRVNTMNQFSEPKLNFTPLALKEIVPLLVVPDFEDEPSETALRFFKSRESTIQKIDILAGRRDFKNSLLQYDKLLSNGVPEIYKAKYPKYFEYETKNLLLRIHNSYFNIIALEIQKLDLTIENKPQLDPIFLEKIKDKYQKIFDSLRDETNPNLSELRSQLKVRLEEIEILFFYTLERKADELLRELKYKEALKELIQIKNKLATHSSSFKSKDLELRIDLKIKKITSYKKGYTINGARTYCGLAEKIYTDLSRNSNPPLTEDQRKEDFKFQTALQLAEDLLTKAEYLEEGVIEACKTAFKLVERDVTNLVASKEKVVVQEESSFFSRIDGRKFLFPGYWHFKEERDNLKSKFLFYGGITSFVSTLALGGVMAKKADDFNRIERLPYYLLLQDNNFFTYSFYTDIQTEERLMQSYNSSKANFSISAAVFGSLYLISLLDSTLIPREKSSTYNLFSPTQDKVPGGSVQFQMQPILSPLSNSRDVENQFRMTYVYNF